MLKQHLVANFQLHSAKTLDVFLMESVKNFYELAFLRLCINLTKMMTLQEGFLKLS